MRGGGGGVRGGAKKKRGGEMLRSGGRRGVMTYRRWRSNCQDCVGTKRWHQGRFSLVRTLRGEGSLRSSVVGGWEPSPE